MLLRRANERNLSSDQRGLRAPICLYLTGACGAYVLVMHFDEVGVARTYCTSRRKLAENKAITSRGDLDFVPIVDAERPAQFDGQHDPPEVVDSSSGTYRGHGLSLAERTRHRAPLALRRGTPLDFTSS
jgi:hypothetical protein